MKIEKKCEMKTKTKICMQLQKEFYPINDLKVTKTQIDFSFSSSLQKYECKLSVEQLYGYSMVSIKHPVLLNVLV